jgi:hypothetical protein
MRGGVFLELDFLFDLSEMVPEGVSTETPPIGTNDKEMSGLSCFRIHGGRRRADQLAEFAKELHRFIANGDYAFVVQLADWYMKEPRPFRLFSQGVDFQVQKLLHTQTRVTQKEQRLVNEATSSAKFFLEKAIGLLRERTGETAIYRWDIAVLKKTRPRRIVPPPLCYFPKENANLDYFLSSAASPQRLPQQIG